MKITRRRAIVGGFVGFSLLAGVSTGFDGNDDEESGSTDTPSTPTPTSTPEPTEKSLSDALRDSVLNSHAESVDEITVEPDTPTSFTEMRFSVGSLTGIGTEQEGAMPVKQALIVLNERDPGVDEYRFFVYADTQDGGEAVLLKVVIGSDAAGNVDWENTPWQELRDTADQYKYNG